MRSSPVSDLPRRAPDSNRFQLCGLVVSKTTTPLKHSHRQHGRNGVNVPTEAGFLTGAGLDWAGLARKPEFATSCTAVEFPCDPGCPAHLPQPPHLHLQNWLRGPVRPETFFLVVDATPRPV